MEHVTGMVKINNIYDVIIGDYKRMTLVERSSHRLEDSIETNI